MNTPRAYRAGQLLEDFCRACRTDRMHVVVVADSGGEPFRVRCGYCDSEHNYRGGPRVASSVGIREDASPSRTTAAPEPRPAMAAREPANRASAGERAPWPLVSERERTADHIMVAEPETDLELLLRRVIREEAGLTAVAPAEKWRGGSLVLRPGAEGLQEKSWPIETFFHKVVMLRNRLRTLEQQVNASDLPDDQKVKLQGYVSGCYGSLTSFNVLFADEADQFKGSGGA